MTFTSDEKGRATVPPLSREVERDASFYFDDDPMAIFLVENKLFKVHRHFFIKGSQIFQDMFSTANTNQEGETDEKPITLPDVTQHEFQTLLKFFYSLPSRVLGTGPVVLPGVTELTLEDKLSLLSISHRFIFDDIFHFIIQRVHATSIPTAKRIRLGNKYNIAEWLLSAYVALLDRSPGDLSAEEAEALGYEGVACLYKAKCFMYQERVEVAGESPMDNRGLGGNPCTQKKNDFGRPPRVVAFNYNDSTTNFGFSAKNSPNQASVKPGKMLTPTSEVVKKFFKLT